MTAAHGTRFETWGSHTLSFISLLLASCVTITQPQSGATLNNPVTASIGFRSQYCANFKVTLDGADVTGQFSPQPPAVALPTATFNNVSAGAHTLTASADTLQYWFLVPYCGSGSDTVTFTIQPPGFSLSASPNPLKIIRRGQGTLTIGVSRTGGFTGSVTVSVSGLSTGVTAAPSSVVIPAASNTTTIAADQTAAQGQTVATLNGTAGTLTASTSFTVAVAPPTISSVSPTVQARGGTASITASDYDSTTCANNTVQIGSASVVPSSCSPTISFQVPQTAPFGSQPLSISTSGLVSNSTPFTVARAPGPFVEITSSIEGQVASQSCSTGAVQLGICAGVNCAVPTEPFTATFTRSGAQIGHPLGFHKNNTRVSGLGGAGFSLCSVGGVLDADTTGFSPQLMGIQFVDLATGHFFPSGGDYTFNYVTPSGNASYVPRIYRSPDGTILIIVTASTIGPTELTAAVFDQLNPNSNPDQSCQSSSALNAFSATITASNQVSVNASFAGTTCTIAIH